MKKENTFINWGNPPGLKFFVLFSFVLFVILNIVTVFFHYIGENNVSILQSILINIASTVITSIIAATFIYFKFFKRIPEETEKRLSNMLDKRLAADGNWHEMVMTAIRMNDTNVMKALNPDNRMLSLEHDRLLLKHDELQKFVIGEAKEAQGRREASGGGTDIGKVIALYEALADDRKSLKIELADLQQKHSNLQYQYELITKERDSLKEKINKQRQAAYSIDIPLRDDEEEPEL